MTNSPTVPTRSPTAPTSSPTIPTQSPTTVVDLFPPYAVNTTSTANNQYPAAWATAMLLVTFLFTILFFTNVVRSLMNLFFREYSTTRKSEVTETKDGWFFRFIVYPFFAGVIAMYFYIHAWTAYETKATQTGNGTFIIPSDLFAFVRTTMQMVMIFSWTVMIIYNYADIKNALEVPGAQGEQARNIVTSFFPIFKPPTNGDPESKYVPAGLENYPSLYYNGINMVSSGRIRAAIYYINDIIWGNLPAVSACIAFAWDKNDLYFNSSLRWFTFWNGIGLTLVWHTWSLYKMAYYANFIGYSSIINQDSYIFIEEKEPLASRGASGRTSFSKVMNNVYSINPGYVRLGFSSDVLGAKQPLKGCIPVQYAPEWYVWARMFYALAEGALIYNDHDKILIYFVVALMPIGLTLLSHNYMYYIAYETVFTFYFLVFSIYNQGVIYTKNDQTSWNYNFITLIQNTNIPTNKPLQAFGTTLNICVYLSFAVFVWMTFSVVMLPQAKLTKDQDL